MLSSSKPKGRWQPQRYPEEATKGSAPQPRLRFMEDEVSDAESKDPTVIIVRLLKGAFKGLHKHQPVIAKQVEPRRHSEDSVAVVPCSLGCIQEILERQLGHTCLAACECVGLRR